MKVSIFSSNHWLYKDTKPNDKAYIKLDSARGSYACVQMMIYECMGKKIKWYAQAIDIPDINFDIIPQMYELLPVCVNRNSEYQEVLDTNRLSVEEMKKYHTRIAPFEVYDAMLPLCGNEFEIQDNNAYFLKWHLPEYIHQGNYKGNIVFEFEGEVIKIPFEINSAKAVVPKNGNMKLINWIVLAPEKYNIKWYSDEFWELCKKINALALYGRQNYVHINTRLFDVNLQNGKITFNYEHAEKYVKMCLDMGFKYIEGPLLHELYANKILPLANVEMLSDMGKEILVKFSKGWYELLKKNNWQNITLQHVMDEPRDITVEEYKEFAKIIIKAAPDIPIIEAVLTTKTEESVDIIVTNLRHYQLHRAEFEKHRQQGREMWLYTCCWPMPPYLNRFLDMPLLSTRLVNWVNYMLNMPGYLHWGFCSDINGMDEYKNQSISFQIFIDSIEQFLPPGDVAIIYPHKDGPLGSVRLEMQRSGVEDFELLTLLALENKPLADKIINMCVNDEFIGNFDLENFETARNLLLNN